MEEAIRAARQEGHAQGLEAGRNEALEAVAGELTRLRSITDQYEKAVERHLSGLDDLTSEIVLACVHKVFGDLMGHREAAVAAVRNVIDSMRHREKLRVRVAPGDLGLLQEAARQAGEQWPAAAQWIADERVELGGCLVETAAGTFDGRLEVQLARLREAILAAKEQWTNELQE